MLFGRTDESGSGNVSEKAPTHFRFGEYGSFLGNFLCVPTIHTLPLGFDQHRMLIYQIDIVSIATSAISYIPTGYREPNGNFYKQFHHVNIDSQANH